MNDPHASAGVTRALRYCGCEGNADPFTSSMVCSYDLNTAGGPCSADSGGPVTLPLAPGETQPVQVGLVSFTLNNGSHAICDLGLGTYT